MSDICEAFKEIIADGWIDRVLFDCEEKLIFIETCTGKRFNFVVKEVKQ